MYVGAAADGLYLARVIIVLISIFMNICTTTHKLLQFVE